MVADPPCRRHPRWRAAPAGLALLAVLAGCPAASPPDAGTVVQWGVPLPPARAPFSDAPTAPPPPWRDAGDGLTEVYVPLTGPAGEPLSLQLALGDGGLVPPAGMGEHGPLFRAPPLEALSLGVALEGGSALTLPLITGRAESRLVVDDRLARLSRGLRLGSHPVSGAVPWNRSWIQRPTGVVLVEWDGLFVEFSVDPSAPSGVRRTVVGPADTVSQDEPCLPREGDLAFIPLKTGTVAWDLRTHALRPGAPADATTGSCQSARKGVPRALLPLKTGGAVVVSWTADAVSEVFREPGPVRPAFSADGSTVGFTRSGTSASGWVGERVDLASGVRSPVVVGGPAAPFLPSDGRVLLVLESSSQGLGWQPCSGRLNDWCVLHFAGPQPIGNVVGLAVADDAPSVLLSVREIAGNGAITDRLLQIDLVTGAQVPFVPSGHTGLPDTRWLVRGNLLPLQRGVANALTRDTALTGMGPLLTFLSNDGSVWASLGPGSPAGVVDHTTGVASQGPFRNAVVTGDVLEIGQRAVTRSFYRSMGGVGVDPRWADAACMPYTAGELYGRNGQPFSQASFCSP